MSEKDVEKYFSGISITVLFFGLGLGVILGATITQDISRESSNLLILAGLICALFSYIVLFERRREKVR